MARERFIFSTKPQRRTTWKTTIWVVIVLVVLGGGIWFFFPQGGITGSSKNKGGSETTQTSGSTTGTIPEISQEKILCDREGGRFVQIPEGISTCAPRTQDAGKTCRNKSECEGNCLATSTSGKTGTGVCDDFVQPAGTRSLISEGKVIRTVVE